MLKYGREIPFFWFFSLSCFATEISHLELGAANYAGQGMGNFGSPIGYVVSKGKSLSHENTRYPNCMRKAQGVVYD